MAEPDSKVDGAVLPLSASEREQMVKAVEAAQQAQKAQNAAISLRDKARIATNSKERERYLREAYEKEVEANGQSKLARRMQSGTWQGLAAGGGIGAGVGLGLGTVVGALLGGIVSIPTTGLGALVGSGVGALHGPWIKLGNGEEKRFEDAKPEEVVEAMEMERGQDGAKKELGEVGNQAEKSLEATASEGQQKPQRKKPRKLEIRSGKKPSESPSRTESPRRPRKLEVRSPSAGSRPSMSRTSTSYNGKYDNGIEHG